MCDILRVFCVHCHIICMAWQYHLFPSNLDTFYLCSFFLIVVVGFPISCWIEVELVGILICSRLQWEGNQLVTSEHYVGCGLVLHCFFPSLLWEKCLWWMGVELYEMLFLHLWRWSRDLGLFLCWCAGSHWLTDVCWTILVSLRWIQLDRGVWSFFMIKMLW